MAISRRTLVLTGARAGTDCVLARYGFTKGQCTIQGDEKALAGVTLYMGRTYRAFPGDIRPDGNLAAPLPADNGGGSNDRDRGEAGGIPVGDGQQDSGYDGKAQAQTRLLQAVMSLDKNNDEHWTAEGRPRMDAVEAAYGSSGVSRTEVERVAPGFVRSS
jgi:hypothetical protein